MRFVVEKVRHERSQNTDLRCHFTIRNKHVTDYLILEVDYNEANLLSY